jgi:hypothetical protein
LALSPGAQWGGDRMLLSVSAASVKFVAGSTLYEQDQEGFLMDESRVGISSSRPAAWLRGISLYDMPFCMGLASALAPAWTATFATCSFLERFSLFYRINRGTVESASIELRYVLDGLYAARRWPSLFIPLMQAMGEGALASLPKGVAAADIGAFLGRLLAPNRQGSVALDQVPQCLRDAREKQAAEPEEWERIPQYKRTIESLERSAARVAPLIEHLRAAL